MSSELEARLADVPERWRDATRTRVYAVMDYEAAGNDGGLLVDVLARRTGLTTSAFYALVRRWRQSRGDVTAMAPWARRPGSKPRVPEQATLHIDAKVLPMIAENPSRPTEPIAQGLLADWPVEVPRPGISYIRKRVNQLRSEHQKKTRRVNKAAGDDEDGRIPEPRWPLDVIIIDHIAIEAIVWADEDPTLPIVTFAIDSASGEPVGVAIGLDDPAPSAVMRAIADLAGVAAERGAPGPPTIIVSTAYARGWPEMTVALTNTGAKVVARRSKKLSFGPDANRMLNGRIAGYRLAPRLGHRPRSERATPRAVVTMPDRELDQLEAQLRAYVELRRDAVVIEESWPPAAKPSVAGWSSLAALPDTTAISG